jgi:hypothetical protein
MALLRLLNLLPMNARLEGVLSAPQEQTSDGIQASDISSHLFFERSAADLQTELDASSTYLL